MPVEYLAITSLADEGWDVNALEKQRWEANEAYGQGLFPPTNLHNRDKGYRNKG